MKMQMWNRMCMRMRMSCERLRCGAVLYRIVPCIRMMSYHAISSHITLPFTVDLHYSLFFSNFIFDFSFFNFHFFFFFSLDPVRGPDTRERRHSGQQQGKNVRYLSLKTENQKLKTENQKLKTKNQKLKTEYTLLVSSMITVARSRFEII